MKKVTILGASGYTGAELVRILSNHPEFVIVALSADKKSGLNIGRCSLILPIYRYPI